MARQSQEITKIQTQILDALQLKEDIANLRLFYNARTLRLTSAGLQIFKKYYDHWEFRDPPMTAGQLLNLLKKMRAPYYTTKNRLILFTEQDAFMCKLAGPKGWLDGK